MGDTINETTTNVIDINVDPAAQSIEDLTKQLGTMATVTAEAKEGISHVGEEYQFANKNLQVWYDSIKQMHQEHNKLTVDIISGMQDAAKAAKVAATATGEAGNAIKKVNEGILSSTENKKRAFEDIGRLITGENFGLRQIAGNFGLVGPEVVIAGAAVGFLADKLYKYYEDTNDAARATRELGEVAEKAADKMAEPLIAVEKMQDTFAEADAGKISRKEALDEYNKTFGKTLGIAKDFNEAESLFAKKSGAYVEAMQLRAEADAAYGLAKEANAKAIKAQITGEVSTFDRIKAGFISMVHLRTSDTEEIKRLNKEEVDDAKKNAQDFSAFAKSKSDAADVLDKANGLNTRDGGKDDKKKKEHDNSLEEQKRYLEESAKINEDAQQKEITSENIKYKKIYDDLVAHHHSTEALTEQHNANLAGIDKKYADKRAEAEKKFKEKQAAELAKALDELQKQEDAFDAKGAVSTENKYQKEISEVTAQYKKLADQDMLFGRDITAITRSYYAQIDAIKKAEADADFKTRQQASQKTLNEEFQFGVRLISQLKGHYAQKKALLAQERADAKANLDQGYIDYAQYTARIQETDRAALEIKKQQQEQEKMIANSAASTLDSLAKLAGEKTAAGKDLAVASATIKAIQAGVNVFEGFTADFPGPVGIALGAIAAAGVGASLFAEVKKIESVKIPGASGGGSSSSSSSSLPSAPVIPAQAKTTNLSASSMSGIRNNSANQSPIKAVVVEADVTNSQSRIAGYKSGGTLN